MPQKWGRQMPGWQMQHDLQKSESEAFAFSHLYTYFMTIICTSNCQQSLQHQMRRIICFLSRCHTSNWYLTHFHSCHNFYNTFDDNKKTTRDCHPSLQHQMRRIVHILSCCHTSNWYLTRHVLTPTRTCQNLLLLRYESSSLKLYKELSSSIFQSLWVSESDMRDTLPDLHFVQYIKA